MEPITTVIDQAGNKLTGGAAAVGTAEGGTAEGGTRGERLYKLPLWNQPG